MRPGRAAQYLFIGLVGLFGAACGGPTDTIAKQVLGSETSRAIDTIAASTRQALVTLGAAPTKSPAGFEGAATSTAPSITPQSTPTPASVWVEVRIDTNCRIGPGKDFEMVGALLVGERTRVVQRSTIPDYWVVDNPDNPGRTCYLWGAYATVEGDLGSLPLDVPPTPTPVPASIAGWSYIDRNGNGTRDSEESGEIVGYARFTLRVGNCPGEETLRLVESNAYGRLFIPSLLSGTYCLIPDPESHTLLPEQYEIELESNQQLDDINFRLLP
jgi:hypothetical protein